MANHREAITKIWRKVHNKRPADSLVLSDNGWAFLEALYLTPAPVPQAPNPHRSHSQ